ncbi:hypothetical protein ACH3XW_18090 [Acanthocheilonema viteae]|uniref:Uncharacterized protein n=1 Tax=Acanthocheilonema viteae TaxID=6277 RepID=A0A498S4J6_ACAVI|nr:unnamed protein product [Acanthocheilonema viteae]
MSRPSKSALNPIHPSTVTLFILQYGKRLTNEVSKSDEHRSLLSTYADYAKWAYLEVLEKPLPNNRGVFRI